MILGKFYGIGVGPGDPELLTVKAAKVLQHCPHVIVPKAKIKSDSVALEIAKSYLAPTSTIHEWVFPMTTDTTELSRSWRDSAQRLADLLRSGEDACFLTLGDSMVYSTYIYLLRELLDILPELDVTTIPGITSFSASAALTHFPLGEGKHPITIIPTADDLTPIRTALASTGTIVLMKIGERLWPILNLLRETGAIDQAVLVHRAGHPTQQIITNLRELDPSSFKVGYLSIILIHSHTHPS